MKLGNLTKLVCAVALTAISANPLMAAAPVTNNSNCLDASTDWNFTAEASQLLQGIRSDSTHLSATTDTLQSFSRSSVSWQTHASELMLAKERINAIGERIQRLRDIRHLTAPSQQAAIDTIDPVGVNLAAHAQAAIQHLNENQRWLWSDPYTSHLNKLAASADLMRKSVGLHLDLASAQNKIDTLRGQIDSLDI